MNLNLYPVIVGLFALGGAGVSVWSWKNIQKQKKIGQWPTTEARIIECIEKSEDNNELPLVKFSYTVEDNEFQGKVETPNSSEIDLPGFAKKFIAKYPIHSQLNIHFNPENHSQSTVNADVNSEDWYLFYVGISCFLCGLLLLFIRTS